MKELTIEKSRYATKQTGKTEVYPFWNLQDIKNMIDYFEMKEQWHHYLTFMLGLLLGRRIGDTLSLCWSDLYYENGSMKGEITTIEEQKTGKTTTVYICRMAKKSIEFYLAKTGINPIENLKEFVLPTKAKTEWLNHSELEIYSSNTNGNKEKEIDLICKWVNYFGKDFSEKRIVTIYNDWNKHRKHYNCLESFLYEMELKIAIKSQSAAYSSAFKIAADFCDIKYNVNTHSTRKTFGYWSRKIHPHDVDSLEILRDIFVHSDTKTTAHYIGITTERKQAYFHDMGDLIEDVSNGKEYSLKNTPVISIKTSDLRNILAIAVNKNSGEEPLQMMNQLMDMVEECRVV